MNLAGIDPTQWQLICLCIVTMVSVKPMLPQLRKEINTIVGSLVDAEVLSNNFDKKGIKILGE